jgi:hypothetical protein
MKLWLSYRLMCNRSCLLFTRSRFVPKRLLDVGSPENPENPSRVFLVGVSKPVPYATLGYVKN